MEHQDNSFDFLRFAAASMVIWGHAYELNAMPSVPTVFASTVNSLGVIIFFIISGFLVTSSLRRSRNFVEFFWKRALRILPGLMVCTLLSALVLGPLVSTLPIAEYFANPLVNNYLKNSVLYVHYFLPGAFQDNHINAVNGSLWSLPVEALCYIFLGTIGYVIARKECRFCSLVIAAVSVAVAAFFSRYHGQPIIFYHMSLSHIFLVAPYFFVASSMNMIITRRHFRLEAAAGCVALLILVTAAKDQTMLVIAQPVLLSYVVLTIGMVAVPAVRSWSKLGDASYGMYLYAFPIQQTLVLLIGTAVHFHVQLFLALLMSAALGYASWHVVEKHALRLKGLLRRDRSERVQDQAVASTR